MLGGFPFGCRIRKLTGKTDVSKGLLGHPGWNPM